MTLRERLIARSGNVKADEPFVVVKPAGKLDDVTVGQLHQLAVSAREGDTPARDGLYFSLQPRLLRISTLLKPWPNLPGMTGIWDRDDVRQECWCIYMDLLESWNGATSFVPYFLARFQWRLRDRILRGIGKSTTSFGSTRIPEELLSEVLTASDADQPESVFAAKHLLNNLLLQSEQHQVPLEDMEAWLELVQNTDESALASPMSGSSLTAPSLVRKVG